jgi:hypothetical protein
MAKKQFGEERVHFFRKVGERDVTALDFLMGTRQQCGVYSWKEVAENEDAFTMRVEKDMFPEDDEAEKEEGDEKKEEGGEQEG